MDSVHLIGAEDVSRAGYTMRDAASSMNSAASSIAHTLEQHQRFMDDWLGRLEALLAEKPEHSGPTPQSIFEQVFGRR